MLFRDGLHVLYRCRIFTRNEALAPSSPGARPPHRVQFAGAFGTNPRDAAVSFDRRLLTPANAELMAVTLSGTDIERAWWS